MTQDEIIEMARQAWSDSGESWVAYGWFEDRAKALEAFAKLVAEKAFKDGYAIGETAGFKQAIKLERARGQA